MDFWTAMRVLLRRWYVVALGVVLTLGVAAGLFSIVPPTYKASGLVLLIGPTGSTGPEAATTAQKNPYLGFGGSLNVMAQVTAKVMNSETVVKQILGSAPSVEYLVDLEPGDAPLVSVVVTGHDPTSVVKTQNLVQASVGTQLQELQAAAGAPEDTWIQVTTVSRPAEASYQPTSRIRAAAGVVVLGGAGTLLATFLVEGQAERQRRRRKERAARAAKARKEREAAEGNEEGEDGEEAATPSPPTLTPLPTPVGQDEKVSSRRTGRAAQEG